MHIVKLHDNRITLINGDCLEVLPKVKPNTIDLIMADPPYYGVVKDQWDNEWKTLEDHLAWSKQWLNSALACMKDTSSLYVWGALTERCDTIIHIKLLIDRLNALTFKDMIAWKKDRGGGTRRGWVQAREECLWYVKNNKTFLWNEDHQYSDERRSRDKGLPVGQHRSGQNGYGYKSDFKRITSIWTDITELGSDVLNKKTQHTTPKPQKAIARIVNAHTNNDNQVVCDPFMGSGTTGEVCVNLNRRFIGIEKDETSFNEAVQFIKNAIAMKEQSNVI